jgi:hypothetical protein
MTDPAGWEVRRHRVALCGQVLNADGTHATGAKVAITDGPRRFAAKLKSGAAAREAGTPHQIAPNVTRVRPDGIYFFLDLPEGEYTVSAEGARAYQRAVNRGKVIRKKDGSIQRAVLDMKFPSG